MRMLLLFVPAAVLIAGCCQFPHTDELSKRLSTAKTRDDLKSYCPKEGGKPNTALISYYINVEVEKNWWKRVGAAMPNLSGVGKGGLVGAILVVVYVPIVMIVQTLSDNWVRVGLTHTITVTYDADGNIVRYDKPLAQPSPPERFKDGKRVDP